MAYETVSGLFTAICNAVRTKDGSMADISHQDIPQKILDIPSGGGATNLVKGTFTPATDININISGGYYAISHPLGKIPDFVLISLTGITNFANTENYDFIVGIKLPDNFSLVNNISSRTNYGHTAADLYGKGNTEPFVKADENAISIMYGNNCYLRAGRTYEYVVGVLE